MIAAAQFTLPELPLRIAAEFKVCWKNAKGEAGLSFLSMPFDAASAFLAWLARKLEQELSQVVAEKFR